MAVALSLAAGHAGVAMAQDSGAAGQWGGVFAGGQMIQGTVTAVAGDRLTLKTEQGEVYQVVATTNTRVMLSKERQPGKVANIAVGSGVGAMGLLDAPTKTVHAMFVMVVDAEQMRKAREGMGKVYILGKVMKIEETTLTILRPDGVTQKIEVDEGTSFKRGGGGGMRTGMMGNGSGGDGLGSGAEGGGGDRPRRPVESITLMDVKVGDSVGGQGALKNGVFVPKELNVMPRLAKRQRRSADGTGVAPGKGGSGAGGSGEAGGGPPPR